MIKIFINDIEVVCSKEIEINEEMLATSSTILNNCYPKEWDNDEKLVKEFFYPKDYSKCRIYQDDELIFCGVVKNTGNISLNPRYPHYVSLQLLDFKTFLSEGETLDFVISNKTITEAIKQVIDAVKDYGFVIGNVNIFGSDELIGAYSTLDKTAYDVFQYIADITQSRWFTRVIDENTIAIDFYDPTLMPKKDNIEYNQEYWIANNIQDMSFSYGTYDYRNKQVINSDEIYADISYKQSSLTDGYNSNILTINNIAKIISIKVDYQEVSFATNLEKDLGISADFYYTAGKNIIEFDENYKVDAGKIIDIEYIPLVRGRQVVKNDDEINRIATQTNRKGIIARYEKRSDILNSNELNEVAQSYLRYKGSAEINLTMLSFNKKLYNIGDVVHFNSPIEELEADYMVKTVKTKIISTGDFKNVFYTYIMSSNFNSENQINYFDNQRRKVAGNIEEGETIARNIDIENQANIIFKDVSYSEVIVSNSNVLDSILNSPFND